MARATYGPLFSRISGSIGGITVSNPAGGPVVYARPHSKKQLSPRALEHIQVLQRVNSLWASTTEAEKGYWRSIAAAGYSPWGETPPARQTARQAFTAYFSLFLHCASTVTTLTPRVDFQPVVAGVTVNLWEETWGCRVRDSVPGTTHAAVACWISWPRGNTAQGAPGRTWSKIFPPVGVRDKYSGRWIDDGIYAEIGIPPEFRPFETGTFPQGVKPWVRACGFLLNGTPALPKIQEYTAPTGNYHVEVPAPDPVYLP